MTRVKFNVNSEYAYVQNFKILQTCFTKHQIDRLVPVEALIKCKMQDNLEFLQWTKRFWDQYYPGGDYDALGRRKASGAPAPTAPPATSSRTSGVGAARRGVTPTSTTAARTPRAPGVAAASAALVAENGQLKDTVAGLERERDFYFSKLRDIELLLQQAVEANPEIEKDENGLIKHVQAILYSTEEGFEIPAEGEADMPNMEEQETF
ncbi:hypothetical protein MMC12_007641 [Toensbergia leucococca]|nr:hypothetical protein [Toensbergia leucococca]